MSFIALSHISLTAEIISTITAISTPQNTPCTREFVANFVSIVENITIAQNAENVNPVTVVIAPNLPRTLYPTKIDMFIAISPGKD